ncbi:MAG: DUF1156 domain-containing protein [Candidatus Binatia bacterium]
MIPKECKRLAEVDFPIAVVSRHAAREKSIRHGHPSTLHLWWARRPLGACRAVLLGLLLPDPCDEHCPQEFKTKARELLPSVQGNPGPRDVDLRGALLKFIGDFSAWELSGDGAYLEVARGLVKAANLEDTPLVVDPFAGGGSIPLEALRLDCETFASDLNPVACLILKVMLEDIPRHGALLAEELRRVGAEIKQAAEKELAEFYPPDPDGNKPIAYLWARTVRCEAPDCGAEIPLLRSLWLCKKANRRRALRYKPLRQKDETPRLDFEIFEPASEHEVPAGTVSRAKATCELCKAVLPPQRVRAQLAAQRGGADVLFNDNDKGKRIAGARLLAVVVLRPGERGRHYRLPKDRDYEAVWRALNRLKNMTTEPLPSGLSPVPDEALPPIGTLGFRVQRYGMLKWGDLFTIRQKLALVTLARQIGKIPNLHSLNVIGLLLPKLAERLSSLVSWISSTQAPRGTFARQALPIVWDFLEMVPIMDQEELPELVEAMAKVCDVWAMSRPSIGEAEIADACGYPLPDESAFVWFTDPPYYDAIPYSDLSDFFYVWLKRAMPGHSLLYDPLNPQNPLTPKLQEIVQDETKQVNAHVKDRDFFERAMAKAFAEGRRVLKKDGIGCVVFAHKTTEGWEALLSGMIQGGWVITGSWPIATERGARLRAKDSAALATSVHLICRPRTENRVGDWDQVLRELPTRVGKWMEQLQAEGVRGADLVFACIGPALEIFSRYSTVETPEGREISLPEFLEKVWEIVGRIALEQVLGTEEARARNSTAGALEEDARLTALFLWALQSTNGYGENGNAESLDEEFHFEEGEEEGAQTKRPGYTLIFDVVRRFAQPLGIHLTDWEGRIIEMKKGIVRLLTVTERAQQLFGRDGAGAVADRLERGPTSILQLTLFPIEARETARPRRVSHKRPADVPQETLKTKREATTLDRVHAAMLLQASGKANALRTLLRAEQERGPEFLRLANALSALYPRDSEEKRLLDGMLLGLSK